MAQDEHISDAITELMERGNSCDSVKAVRGELFFHLASVWDVVSESGEASAEIAEIRAEQCRERARALLGRIA